MMPAYVAFDNALRRVEEFAARCALRDAAIRQAIEDPTCEDEHPFKVYARSVEANVYARSQDYALAITLAYGALETFIIDIASDYLAWAVAAIPKFSDLPASIRDNYVSGAVDLMVRSRSPNYRGSATTADIAKSVVACAASDADARTVILECMLYKDANFRVGVIDQFLGRIGIGSVSTRIVKQVCFEDHVKLGNPSATPADFQAALLRLNELVDRRNEVAHGTMDESLALGIVTDDVKFLRALGAALDQIVEDKIAEDLLPTCGRCLGHVHGVFNDNVVALNMEGVVVEVGDLVAVSTGGCVRSGRIRRIEIDHVVVQKTGPETPNAGLELTVRVKESHTFAIIPSVAAIRNARPTAEVNSGAES